MRTQALLTALALAVPLVVPSSGAAQPQKQQSVAAGVAAPTKPSAAAPKESDPVTEQARELYAQGTKHYGKGEWAKAYAAFLGSFRLKPHYATAGNLGACEFKLGKHREAAEHFVYFFREQPANEDPVARQRTRELFEKARAQIGGVTIRVNVEGALIKIDGEAIGEAPLAGEVFVDPGERMIEVARPGYRSDVQVVRLAPGSAQTVSFELLPFEKPVSSAPKKTGEDPTSSTSLGPLPLVIAGAGIAAIGLGVGIGLTAAANGKSTEADEKLASLSGPSPCFGREGTPECMAIRDALESQDGYTDGAKASFVIGGLAALGAGAVFVLWPRPKPAAAARVGAVPWVSAEGSGLVVRGTF